MQIDSWLQDALQNFIEEWVESKVLQENQDIEFVMANADGNPNSVRVRWRGYYCRDDAGRGKPPLQTGSIVITPAEALRLFLEDNIGGRNEVVA